MLLNKCMWSKKLRTGMYEKLCTNLFSTLKDLKDVALDNFSFLLHNFIHALDLVRFTENLGLQPFFFFSLFVFPLSHLTIICFLHRQFPGALNCERKKNVYPHSEIYARTFTHISMHAYWKDKKSLLWMNRQQHAHVDVIAMH